MLALLYAYVCSIAPIYAGLLLGKEEEAPCDIVLHEVCGSVFGAVAWTVLTRAELAANVQALRRRAHAPRIADCKRLSLVIRFMARRKCASSQ